MFTMRDRRQRNGKISKDETIRRYNTILNKVYLSAQRLTGGDYIISSEMFESIQTELDFSDPKDPDSQKVAMQIKKRYRNRKTYSFWFNMLESANYFSRDSAKASLLIIFNTLDRKGHYGSMTHSRYALETLELALDDYFNTNELILHQITPPTPKKKKLKSSVKAKTKKPNKSCNQPF